MYTHRAVVNYSNATTGDIHVKIPSVTGLNSVIALSKIGRKEPWVVPDIGEQILVTSDDSNFTNVFWVQTDAVEGPQGDPGTNGTNGDWSTAQPVINYADATTAGVLKASTAGKLVYNTGAQTITITSATGFSIGQRVDFARLNSNSFIIAQGVGATVNRTPIGANLRDHYSAASLICTFPNTYLLIGDLG